MKAIVCVKQVPDTSGKVAVKENGQLDRASMMTITNPDDLNAIEAALQLKDQTGCEVVAISMGPPPQKVCSVSCWRVALTRRYWFPAVSSAEVTRMLPVRSWQQLYAASV